MLIIKERAEKWSKALSDQRKEKIVNDKKTLLSSKLLNNSEENIIHIICCSRHWRIFIVAVIIIVLVGYKFGTEHETMLDDNLEVKELDYYELSCVGYLSAIRAELAY